MFMFSLNINLKGREKMKEIEKLIKEAEEGYTATITDVVETTSHEYYGKDSYDDRKGYKVTYCLDKDNTELSEFFAIPKALGLKDSKIMAFLTAYGVLPKKNMAVKVEVVEGFFKIKM